ncbi:MAG: ABC transporter substrate-binding protein [Pseudolabrys sp.]
MRRREFIAALGGTAVWPIVARAQQPKPVIGVLHPASPDPLQQQLAEMSRALRQAGFVDGQNLVLEYRWANGQYDRLPALAAELIARRVDMILALGASGAVVKAATQTIPIVAIFGGDPVAAGMVASLNRPGGNLTGVALLAFPLGPKRLEVLREALPGAKVIAVLANPTMAEALPYTKDVAAVARTLGQQIQILNASNDQELESTFAVMKQRGVGALLVMADPYFNVQRELIISLAARHSIPAIYEWRQFTELGGLMSYGSSITDAYRQVGIYAARVLKGEKPAELPVYQTVKVELVINLKTAKTLGIAFPLTLLGRADEVIE